MRGNRDLDQTSGAIVRFRAMRATSRFRVVYDPEIQRGVKDTKAGPKEFLVTYRGHDTKVPITHAKAERSGAVH